MSCFCSPKRHYYLLWLLIACTIILLSGCASYEKKPLPGSVDLKPNISELQKLATSPPAAVKGKLSLTEVATYAVLNNPDLRARRMQLGIAHAEVFAVGLLPDPQLSTSLDQPTGSIPGTVTAFAIGLDYDLMPLVNRGARVESARHAEHRVSLELLWQEWILSQQARTLAVNLAGERKQIALLHEMKDLYQQRYQSSLAALNRGDVTLDVAGTDLTALLDTLSQINQLEQICNDTRHELNLLMGLAPDAHFEIDLPPLQNPPDAEVLKRGLETLTQRRPDLMALQAGYLSQEANVHAAVLSQFPALSIGINHARDTSDVYSAGVTVSVGLPLFSGNRGEVAIEKAVREQLRAEYQARLDQAAVDVDRLIQLQLIISAQQKQLEENLPTLKKLVDRGQVAYQNGDIDALVFLNMESTWLNKRLEQINLEEVRRNNLIALQTLLVIPEKDRSGAPEVPEGEKR